MSPLAAAALLVVALLPLAHLFWGARRPIGGRRYPGMVRGAWLRFGLPPVVLLGLTGQWAAFWQLPDALRPAAALLGADRFGAADRVNVMLAGLTGVVLGVSSGLVLTAWRAWRGRPEGNLLGDASAVRPRGRDELGWGAVLAVTAGITEEAYFRLLLPLLTAQATGSAVAGFVASTLLFGAAHRYQGWRGVAATTVAGAAMAGGYLATGSLLLVMAFHAIGDLSHLVLRPVVRAWIERRRSRSGALRGLR